MKKYLCFMGALFCFLFCTLSVRADLIWEPQDSFYEQHSSQCTYVNRCFTANGPDGTVILYKSPESAKVIDTWENGYSVYISFTYEDSNGIVWGIFDNGPGQTGWMPMEYMKVVYDHISFQEEYGSEIMEQSGALEEKYRGESVCCWEYPGAKEFSIAPLNMPDLPQYSSVYTDEKGYNWGYIGYYYARRDFWICLDQPMADYEQLYPDGGPQMGAQAEEAETDNPDSEEQGTDRIIPEQAETDHSDSEEQGADRIVPQQDHGMVILVTALVALVVLATAVSLVILRKSKL